MRHIVGLAVITAFALGACTKGDEPPVTAAASSAEAPPVTIGSTASTTSAAGIPIKVYKDPNCGCCKEWVKHLEQSGFVVETMDMPDLSAVKDKYGVKPDMQACHTAVVGGYTIEGHVPADVILKLLKEKPSIAGLAVPGMPMGSPGMEGATKEKYDILTFDRAGRTTVYAQR